MEQNYNQIKIELIINGNKEMFYVGLGTDIEVKNLKNQLTEIFNSL